MRKKYKRILILLLILVIGSLALGVSYFSYKSMKDVSIIKTSGNLSINYENGDKLRIKKDKTISFSVINSSEEKVYYYIAFLNPKNIKGDIKYTLTNGDDVTITDYLTPYSTTISSYIEIYGSDMHQYTLSFSSEERVSYSIEISVSEENREVNNFADTILSQNEVKTQPLTEPGKEISTEDEGLIRTLDDYGSAYYFRGNVQNNNVEIDGIRYKIVKINGDGSVKLVLDGITETIKKYYDAIEDYKFKSSNLYTYLNNDWFVKNVKKSEFYVANQKYCNDNTKDNDELLSASRIKVDHIPSFICLGDRVQSKIALLTVDEVIYAGATTEDENKSFYLYNEDITIEYYLLTGSKLTEKDYTPFAVSANGQVVDKDTGDNLRAVRPVITIIKTAVVTGTGTVNDPYILT